MGGMKCNVPVSDQVRNLHKKEKAKKAEISQASMFAKRTREKILNYKKKADEEIKFNKKEHSYTITTREGKQKAERTISEIASPKVNIKGDYKHSNIIGEIEDTMLRDYFSDEDATLFEKSSYPNISKERKDITKSEFEKLENALFERHGKGSIVISNPIPLAGWVKTDKESFLVAGTPDFLVIDPEGNVHIYDLKTKNKKVTDTNQQKYIQDDLRKYKKQVNGYKQLLEILAGVTVSSVNIIWFDTSYPSLTEEEKTNSPYTIDEKNVISYKGNKIEDKEDIWKTPTIDVENGIITLSNEPLFKEVKRYDADIKETSPSKEDNTKTSNEEFDSLRKKLENKNVLVTTENNSNYADRTKTNAEKSNITVAIAKDFSTAGEKLTKQAAGEKYYGVTFSSMELSYDTIANEIIAKLKSTMSNYNESENIIINIAGNGIYTLNNYKISQKDCNDVVYNILYRVKELLEKENKNLIVRSGGQTGIDEAGIIAAMQLEVPALIHTTSNFKFRITNPEKKDGFENISGINNAHLFLQRFLVDYTPTKIESKEGKPVQLDLDLYNKYYTKNSLFTERMGNLQSITPGTHLYAVIENAFKELPEQISPETLAKLYYTVDFLVKRVDTLFAQNSETFKEEFSKEKAAYDYIFRIASRENTLENIKAGIEKLKSGGQDTLPVVKEFLNSLESEEFNNTIQEVLNLITNKVEGREYFALLQESVEKEKERRRINKENVINKYDALYHEYNSTTLKLRLSYIASEFKEDFRYLKRKLVKQLNSEISSMSNTNLTDNEYGDYLDKKSLLQRLQDPEKGHLTALNALGVETIFKSIKERFNKILEEKKENVQSAKGVKRKEKLQYEIKEYEKLIRHFELLSELSLSEIENKISCRFTITSGKVESILNSTSEEEKNNEEEYNATDEEYVRGNDGWSYKARLKESFHNSSRPVKELLGNIFKCNMDGELETDDLGVYQTYNPDYIHNILVDIFSKEVIFAKDFAIKEEKDDTVSYTFPVLEKYKTVYPWIQQIINKIQDNPSLVSSMYSDLRLDFYKAFVYRLDRKDDKYKLSGINEERTKKAAGKAVIKRWEESMPITEKPSNSLFFADGKINKKRAEEIHKVVSGWHEHHGYLIEDPKDPSKKRINGTARNQMLRYLNAAGIFTEGLSLSDVDNFGILVKEMNSLTSNIQFNNTTAEVLNSRPNIISLANLVYYSGSINEVEIKPTFYETGKTFPNFAVPNKISTLSRIFRNPEKRKEYIEKLKEVDFLYDKKNNTFKSQWLRQLDDEFLDENLFEYSEIFKINNKEYSKWTKEDKQLAFFGLFYSQEAVGTNPTYAQYNFPIFSDSETCMLWKQGVYSLNDCIESLTEVAMQELQRMRVVQDRKKGIKEGTIEKITNYDDLGHLFHFIPALEKMTVEMITEEVKPIKEVLLENSNSQEQYKNTVRKAVSQVIEENFKNYLNEISPGTIKEMMKIVMQEGYLDKYGENEKNSTEVESIKNDIINSKDTEVLQGAIAAWKDNPNTVGGQILRSYFYNKANATAQIYQITITDLAYYPNMIELQKRFKQMYASGKRPFTQSKYGKETEKVIYLIDDSRASVNYSTLKQFGLSEDLIESFLNIKATDAQAYRTLPSFRSVMDMFGRWDDETMSATMTRIENNSATAEDFNTIFQIMKPFVFAETYKPDGLGGTLRVHHQQKNSEFLLLAMYQAISNSMSKSVINSGSKLKGLNEFMENNNIDCAMFTSAVKTGCQGAIDIRYSRDKFKKMLEDEDFKTKIAEFNKLSNTNKITYNHFLNYMKEQLRIGKISQQEYNDKINYLEPSAKEVKDILKFHVFKRNGTVLEAKEENMNPEVVHTISFDDYMEAQPNPEHLLDTEAIYGSQYNTYIISDLPDDIEITVGGKKLNKEKIVKLYQELKLEDVLEGYEKASEVFKDIETLKAEMVKLIQTNANFSMDLLNSLDIVEEQEAPEYVSKKFRMPITTPSMLNSFTSMLFSIFRNKVNKHTIKGGAAVLVSSFGLYDTEKEVSQAPKIEYDDNGNLKYVQCYLPAYSKKFYEPFMKKGVLEFDKMPEDLKIAIGYRIPTEDKYSMLPLKIIGFLPPQNGSAIIIPEDIVNIAGIDFDVDKAFLMIHEFKEVREYDYKKMFDDFYTENPLAKSLREEFIDTLWKSALESGASTFDEIKKFYKNKKEKTLNGESLYQYLSKDNEILKKAFDFWKRNADLNKYLKSVKIEKVKYDAYSDPSVMTKAERHNLLIDMAFAILTSKYTKKDYHTPGNFDQIKVEGTRVSIMQDINSIMNLTDTYDFTEAWKSPEAKSKIIQETVKQILSLSKKEVLKRKPSKTYDPLSDSTFIEFHHQNMQGAALIPPYAIGGVSQGKYQHTNLELEKGVRYNNKFIKSLHDIYIDGDKDNPRISEALSQLKAASVDNAKDPVLYMLMQNPETAYIAVFMTYLGMSIRDISLVFNQPLIRDLILMDGNLDRLELVVRAVATDISKSNLEDKKFQSEPGLITVTPEFLASRIIKDTIDKATESESSKSVEVEDAEILIWFHDLVEQAKSIRFLNSVTRTDTKSGAIASTLSRATTQKLKVDTLKDHTPALKNQEEVIESTEEITPKSSMNDLREYFRSRKLPFIQATHTLGIEFPLIILQDYIPHLRDNVYEQVKKLSQLSPKVVVTPKVLNSFYKELVMYRLSKEIDNYEEVRNYYLYYYPGVLNQYKKTGRFRNMSIIQNLKVFNGVITCEATRNTKSIQQQFVRDFDTLLYSEDKEAMDLAKDLFMYSYFKDGLDFGPTSYGKYFSDFFWHMNADFMSVLKEMENEGDYFNYSTYLDLFIINHFQEPNILEEFSVSRDYNPGEGIALKSKNKYVVLYNSRSSEVTLLMRVEDNENNLQEINNYNVTAFKRNRYTTYFRYYPPLENASNYSQEEGYSEDTLGNDGEVDSAEDLNGKPKDTPTTPETEDNPSGLCKDKK